MKAAPFTVALLGAESTGKSTLAKDLLARLSAQLGPHCVAVPEHLRAWCEQHGRAPLREEQAAVASEQSRLIRAARDTPGAQVVLADTSALMVAAYSEQYFNDTSLWPPALADHGVVDLTLLMGLDLPWVADGLFRDSASARRTTDALLRKQLETAGVRYQGVYGQGERRTEQALRAIGAAMGRHFVELDPYWRAGRGRLDCEKCGDPACEHRLFQCLLDERRPTA